MWKDRLQTLGHSGDQAFIAIMSFFEENPQIEENANSLALRGFKRFRKGRRDSVAFSAETVSRKARQLAEWGLLERKHDTSGHTYYFYPKGLVGHSVAPTLKPVYENGRLIKMAYGI